MLYIVTVVECIIHLYIPQHTNLQYIFEVGTFDRIPIFRPFDSCRTKKTLSEYRTNIAIPLQLPDKQHWTSDSPIAIGLTEMYRTKNGEFLLFLCVFLQEFSPFWYLFREFPRKRIWDVGVYTVLLASLLMLVPLLAALLFLASLLLQFSLLLLTSVMSLLSPLLFLMF